MFDVKPTCTSHAIHLDLRQKQGYVKECI